VMRNVDSIWCLSLRKEAPDICNERGTVGARIGASPRVSAAGSSFSRWLRSLGGQPDCTTMVRVGCSPALGHSPHVVCVRRPVVEHGGVKICARGPDERVNLGIDLDTAEYLPILQRAVDVSSEHATEVDHLSGRVVEFHAEGVWSYDLAASDSVDRM
jgi:hypothetical protein